MALENSVFIIGCGDIGRRVAALHFELGHNITALARNRAAAARLRAQGVLAIQGDLDQPASLSGMPLHRALVYYFAPPPAEGGSDPRMVSFLEQLTPENVPAKIIYISTSGVYGDCRGEWVTESAPPNPQTARAKARLHAEQALLSWSQDNQVTVSILRVGGIYGPGRLPVERIRQGQPVVREDECLYTNRIHADDLARICLAAAERGASGAIYNVSDGQTGTMTGYFNSVADHYQLPRPPAITLSEAQLVMTPGMLSYLNESRRLDTTRLRVELGVSLLYPTLEDGLACIR